MSIVNGTLGNDFIHVAGDGLTPPAGYTDNPNATDSADVINSGGGGDDIIHAGGGDDTINFGGDLTAADKIDGGDGNDTLVIGDQTNVTFAADSLTSIEKILLPFVTHQVGTAAFQHLVLNDANVAANASMTIDASGLDQDTFFSLDYSAETDAFKMTVVGGQGDDTITGRSLSFLVDAVDFSQGGSDSFSGTAGVYFGAALSAGDHVGGNSAVRVDGDYSAGLTLTGAMFGDLVAGSGLFFFMGQDSFIGPPPTGGPDFNYRFTCTDDFAPGGGLVEFFARAVPAGNSVFIDDSAETDAAADISMLGGASNDTFLGGAGTDAFNIFMGGTDTFAGNGGDDTVFGGGAVAADDRLDGGAGNDVLFLDGDYSSGLAIDGTDIVNIETINLGSSESAPGGAAFNYDLNATDNALSAGQVMTVDGHWIDASHALSFNGTAESNGTFVITGGQGNDVLKGGGGADTLDGGVGNDQLAGSAGADHLIGGPGDDVFVVDNAGDVVTENAGGGTDTIATTLTSYSLASLPNVENLIFTSGATPVPFTGTGNAAANNITGDIGDDVLYGEGGADTLYGGDGNDILYGQGGADTLRGGVGDDLLFVDDTMDQTIEAAGQGSDRVLTSVSYTLGAGQSIETFTTTSAAATTNLSLVGNALAQTIIGNAGNNVLNDGGAGGNDALKGLGGDDRYVVNNSGDSVIESANGGTDQVLTSVSFTLGAGQSVESLLTIDQAAAAFINLAGNALAQTIVGNAGNNIINDGGAGAADRLIGRAGNDSYVVANAGDHVVEAAGDGSDTVRTSVSFTLDAGQSIETLTPVSYAATTPLNLTGNTLAQTIIGDAGNNILNDGGAGGADALKGLGGNDSYAVNNAGDHIFEAAGGGSDTVRTSVSYTLDAGQSIEAFTPISYASTAAIRLTGNALAQTIIGNAGANVIDGGAGNDTLKGLGGNDTFYFDTALNAATNVDSIVDFTHGTDKIALDHAIFTALGAANPLPAADFTTGAPTTPDQHIIYNAATGALSYDDDGSGAAAAVQFATLTTHPALTSTDIFVV
jgi:serralysin